MGVMGHAFLLLLNKPKVLLGGKAYQFNLVIPNGYLDDIVLNSIKDIQKVMAKVDLGKLRFALMHEDALTFTQKYAAEDRLVTLFPLKLDQVEISTLAENLQKEEKRRKDDFVSDYSILENNCATQVIHWINSSIKKHSSQMRKIPSQWNGQTSSMLSVGSWTANTPLALAPILENSPLVDKEGIYHIHPQMMDRTLLASEMIKLLVHTGKVCKWEQWKLEALRPLIAQPKTRIQAQVIDLLKEEFEVCKKAEPLIIETQDSLADLIVFDFLQYVKQKEEMKMKNLKMLESLYSDAS